MQTSHEITAWRQLAAFIYDIFPVLGILLVTSLIIILVRKGAEIEPNTLWFQLLLLTEIFMYYIYSWKNGGQTLGMRAWKIKIEPNHENNSWLQLIARFLAGALSTVCLGLGIWWQYIDSKNRSWMDLASQSRIVSTHVTRSPQ
ncbi:RDD family protein [Marinicella sp. W31]|uniref:RDD family protein n=1 Tax=Marinicella sp. W31 TaxID=3023713 RepID=UPI003757D664